MKAKTLLNKLSKLSKESLELSVKVVIFSNSDPVARPVDRVLVSKDEEENDSYGEDKPFIFLGLGQ